MVQRGYDIYLLDWGIPGVEDSSLTYDDYTLEYLPRVIRKLKSHSGGEQFSMLGWCLGALITTMYASLRPDDGLKNLILLTALRPAHRCRAGEVLQEARAPVGSEVRQRLGTVRHRRPREPAALERCRPRHR
jgi:poly(3-hydroxyalkanoate) synthetase